MQVLGAPRRNAKLQLGLWMGCSLLDITLRIPKPRAACEPVIGATLQNALPAVADFDGFAQNVNVLGGIKVKLRYNSIVTRPPSPSDVIVVDICQNQAQSRLHY